MAETLLAVRGLAKRYGDVQAVSDASLDVREGEVVCLVGPNGSGKTTLIECIEGLRQHDHGEIELFGGGAGSRRERAGMLGVQLQEEGLPARIRVGEAVRLFAAIYSVPVDPEELVDDLGLRELEKRPFEALSGGQKRRTALALAFIHSPRLAILDEPTSGLDPDGQDGITAMIRTRAAAGTGILATIHDMQIAASLSDRVVVLTRGRTVASGSPGELLATIEHEWCLTGRGIEGMDGPGSGVVLLGDGGARRLYGSLDALERHVAELSRDQQGRVTLRKVDLSDVAYHAVGRVAP